MEGLGAEVSPARQAVVTLYALGVAIAREESGLLVAPASCYGPVESTLVVRAVRWSEGVEYIGHTPATAHTVPDAISEAQSNDWNYCLGSRWG